MKSQCDFEFEDTLRIKEAADGRALIIAAAKKDIRAVRTALEEGLPADAAPAGKPSALCYAALGDHRSLLDLLLEHGASMNYQDELGNTACIYAALAGADCCLRRLVQMGADPTVCNARQQSAYDCCRTDETRLTLTLACIGSHCPARASLSAQLN